MLSHYESCCQIQPIRHCNRGQSILLSLGIVLLSDSQQTNFRSWEQTAPVLLHSPQISLNRVNILLVLVACWLLSGDYTYCIAQEAVRSCGSPVTGETSTDQDNARAQAIRRGSQTAKGGFRNEDEIMEKFNAWNTDEDARAWL